jgi:DnaJ-class molecular chaperone
VNVDYYKSLGLTKSASKGEIKNMYYKLCYEYHPDRAGSMHQDKFKDINIAYEVLKDEDKKKKYDEARKLSQEGGSQSSRSKNQGPTGSYGQGSQSNYSQQN